MSHRKDLVMRALDHLQKAMVLCDKDEPRVASMHIGWAMADFRYALEIEPSDTAMKELTEEAA